VTYPFFLHFLQIQSQLRRKLLAGLKIYQCQSFGRFPMCINWMINVSAAIGCLQMFYFELYKHLVMSLWDSNGNTSLRKMLFEILDDETGFKNRIHILEMLNLQRKLCRNFSKYFFLKWINRLAGLECSSSCASHD
jgi:hypothetical protein